MYSGNKNTNEQDRREFPRLEARLAVDMRTKYIYTTASVLNVSNSGLFIKTQNPLPEGSELEIITHLPSQNKPLRFKGVVRWIRESQSGALPSGMGIELITPDSRKMWKLVKAIQQSPKSL